MTSGGQLIASCTASSSTVGRTLSIDGVTVADRISADRLSTTSNGATSTWTIDPVLPEDSGEYECSPGSQSATDLNSPPQTVTVFSEFQVCSDARAWNACMHDLGSFCDVNFFACICSFTHR